MKLQPRVGLIALAALAIGARADFYRWTDAEGNPHVTTEPPPSTAKKVKKTASRHAPNHRPLPTSPGAVLGQAGVLTGPGSANPLPVDLGGKKTDRPLDNLQPRGALSVEIYSAAWCGWCTKAKAYFSARGVPYREYDIDHDAAAKARLKSLNPSGGIPVTVINGRTIQGYSPSQFDAALKDY